MSEFMEELIEAFDNLEALRTINDRLNSIDNQLGDIMAAVQVEQSDLDAIATNLASVGATLTSEIADLEAKVAAGQPLTPADLTGLKAAQSTLDALAVPASTPVPDPTPSPVADPTPPAAVDPSVPPAAPTV